MLRFGIISFSFLIVAIVLLLGFPQENVGWFELFASKNSQLTELIRVFRIPELIICLVAGASLSICGLLLQTVLNNPLAGPSVLGLTSGAHLFVALGLFGFSFFGFTISNVSLTFLASVGSLIVSLIMFFLAIRFQSRTIILLVGVMVSGFLSSITEILISQADALSIRSFSMWSMGSLQKLDFNDIPFVVAVCLLGVFASFLLAKPLNTLQLGETHARALGVHVKRTQILVFVTVAVLSGLVTSFCGPIGFIGLIVPNLVRVFIKTGNHRHLIWATMLTGMCVMLFCDLLIHLFNPIASLPINAVCSFLGVPTVVYLILKNKLHA
jgi:iron complex transport system permease protein